MSKIKFLWSRYVQMMPQIEMWGPDLNLLASGGHYPLFPSFLCDLFKVLPPLLLGKKRRMS